MHRRHKKGVMVSDRAAVTHSQHSERPSILFEGGLLDEKQLRWQDTNCVQTLSVEKYASCLFDVDCPITDTLSIIGQSLISCKRSIA